MGYYHHVSEDLEQSEKREKEPASDAVFETGNNDGGDWKYIYSNSVDYASSCKLLICCYLRNTLDVFVSLHYCKLINKARIDSQN